jgi:hypothetical protein
VAALRFVNVFTSGIAAGGLLTVLTPYALTLRDLDPREVGHVHALFHPRMHYSMMATTLVAAAAAVAIAAIGAGSTESTALVLAGIPGAAVQALLSRFYVVPMSEEMMEWDKTGAPEHPRKFLARWTLLHTGRVLGAMASFACYLVSLLVS